jgi:hypothetical protein
MRRFYLITFILSAFLLFSNLFQLLAQEQDNNPFPTPNTQIGAKPDPKKQGDKEKKIRYIITNDTKETLAGNICFEEAIREMGFQYLAVPKGQPPNKNGFSRWWRNFAVKFMITLKNGPFWKIKVNRKYEECKFGSGDYTG